MSLSDSEAEPISDGKDKQASADSDTGGPVEEMELNSSAVTISSKWPSRMITNVITIYHGTGAVLGWYSESTLSAGNSLPTLR